MQVLSQNPTDVTGKKPQSRWAAAGIVPRAFRLLSQPTELRPLDLKTQLEKDHSVQYQSKIKATMINFS